MSKTSLQLAKQNFKFSAAHFLIFDEKNAERLHGHNYQVKVELEFPETAALKNGFFVDFNVFKTFIKSQLDLWDERVLLPAQHPDMKITSQNTKLEVQFRDRYYAFPANEVVLLPVNNTSVEQLSKLLAENFMAEFRQYNLSAIAVSVEESIGQGATTKVTA